VGLSREDGKGIRGYGITLTLGDTPISDIWYKELKNNPDFIICNGVDGTGNVYSPANLDDVKRIIEERGDIIDIVVSDGGFEIRKVGDKHMENFQELFSGRIIMSELLMCTKVLRNGGHFVCKLFDAFSALSQSIIFLTKQMFERTFIVKPQRSRIVNSERYLVGKFLQKEGEHEKRFEFLKEILAHLHKICQDDKTPLSVVPIATMKADDEFITSTRLMCNTLCSKQSLALHRVMDIVDKEIEEDISRRPNKRRR